MGTIIARIYSQQQQQQQHRDVYILNMKNVGWCFSNFFFSFDASYYFIILITDNKPLHLHYDVSMMCQCHTNLQLTMYLHNSLLALLFHFPVNRSTFFVLYSAFSLHAACIFWAIIFTGRAICRSIDTSLRAADSRSTTLGSPSAFEG